jgi:cytochrome c oxidase assembly protein subunit 15
MGLVFLIPFVYFIYKKALNRGLIKKLVLLVLLAALAASFGWIMVASGLIERPWVNAYKLSLHLITALLVIAYLWWIIIDYKTKYFTAFNGNADYTNTGLLKKYMYVFLFILTVQIFLGGMMSGMKIAVLYPTWPNMYGQYIPDAITEASAWTYKNMVEYDSNSFFPALVHFMHRNWAYLLFIAGIWIVYKMIVWSDQKKIPDMRLPAYSLAAVILIQIFLGIITVISSTGKVPVLLGVLHQAGALILYITALYIIFVLLASERRRDIRLTLKVG